MLTVDGLASGLDTASILEGLLSLQQQQVDRIESRKQEVIAEQTAFGGVQAGLLNLQSRLANLTRTQNGAFEARTAASSHEDVVTAAASSNATPGVYELQVSQLAKAHQIASTEFG